MQARGTTAVARVNAASRVEKSTRNVKVALSARPVKACALVMVARVDSHAALGESGRDRTKVTILGSFQQGLLLGTTRPVCLVIRVRITRRIFAFGGHKQTRRRRGCRRRRSR